MVDRSTADKRVDGQQTPHIVMIVANDVTVDTRVRKMAHDLAAAGPKVTVLGMSATDHREVARLGKATIIRLPVPELMRSVARSSVLPGRSPHRYELIHRIQYERERFRVHQMEIGANIGWLQRDYFAGRRNRLARANDRERQRIDRLRRRNDLLLSIIRTAKSWNNRVARDLAVRGSQLLIKVDRRFGQFLKNARNRRLEAREDKSLRRMQAAESRMRANLSAEYKAHEKRIEKMRAKLTQTAATDRTRLFGQRIDWRNELPELHDYETAFGPELDQLAPDVIHAHDVHLLGVAARAVGRAIVTGRHPTLIYDAHEYVQGLARYSKRVLTAWSSLEREYIHRADHIITVSAPLAELLEADYRLKKTPTVVMNIPIDSEGGTEDVRAAADVEEAAPLVVYSGGLDPTRGVHTLVEAVGRLDGVHLAIVSKAETDYVRDLMAMAEEKGYASRLHMVPFVQPQHVVSYLKSATIAVHPMVSGPMNHEIALPNKIFEYMHAGLPIIVSNCRAMAQLVEELRIGEVFESENVESLVDALTKVIEHADTYRQTYVDRPDFLDIYSWSAQRQNLLQLYSEILDRDTVNLRPATEDLPSDLPAAGTGIQLGIGPMNMAGQAWEWAKALERLIPDLETEVFEIFRPNRVQFPADVRIDAKSWHSLDWQLEWARHIGTSFSHVLLESGAGALGRLNGGRLVDDLSFLREREVGVAAVFHGSEVRDPRRHRQFVNSSPFNQKDTYTQGLIESTESNLAMVENFDGPIFVSTLDLLDYIPGARWLPQVLTMERWEAQPFDPSDPLKVLFVPTNSRLKGGRHINQICGRLHDEGVIDLRIETHVPGSDMPDLIASTDVLIDGLVLGLYGTTAVEGMATGRVVLANLERVLHRLPEQPPIVHTTPKTLEQLLRQIARSPRNYKDLAERGPEYVRKYHDGRYAANSLEVFLLD